MFVVTKKNLRDYCETKDRPLALEILSEDCPKDTRQEESFRYRCSPSKWIERKVIVKDDIVFHI